MKIALFTITVLIQHCLVSPVLGTPYHYSELDFLARSNAQVDEEYNQPPPPPGEYVTEETNQPPPPPGEYNQPPPPPGEYVTEETNQPPPPPGEYNQPPPPPGEYVAEETNRPPPPPGEYIQEINELTYPGYGKEEAQVAGAYEEMVAGQHAQPGGAIYIRWGRTVCQSGSEKVYSGRAAAAHYTNSGGGNNYQCFPNDPEYSDYLPGVQGHSYAYGVEYEHPIPRLKYLHDHNVPCAVCRVTNRVSSLMIPAKISCPQGWAEEYEGYLMTERINHNSKTFICVDRDAEAASGGVGNQNGGLLYHVEAQLHCPPYVAEKEVTCVVCTK